MEKVDLRVQGGGPLRCAYCHDSVPSEDRAACADCLAVHHEGCWRESGRCASCQGARPLFAPGAAAPPAPAPLPVRTAPRPVPAQMSPEAIAASTARARREAVAGGLVLVAIIVAASGLAAAGSLTRESVAVAAAAVIFAITALVGAWRIS